MTVADQKAASSEQARAALAAEWLERAPKTSSEVLDFYRTTENLEADLDAFHESPDRQMWTKNLVHIAGSTDAKLVIDIGSGAGHDLRALREAHPNLKIWGVEPNRALRAKSYEVVLSVPGSGICDTVGRAPIEQADLISCFDVLEHVPDPEQFLGSIASRAKINSVILETCATFDCGTPLHLRENRGWEPGRVLERHGWEKIAGEGRMHVWQRMATQNRVSTSLIVCTFRSVSMPTHRSIVQLLTKDRQNERGWREQDGSEAGINRARSIRASKWWSNTADDVFLMLDDDIVFEPEHAEHIVDLCRNGHDVIAAAYPVRDGGHLALRTLEGQNEIQFGPGQLPKEMLYVSTGFFAVHRRVLDALIPTLPLCHANQPWSFWPLFDFKAIPDENAGGYTYLSEDWYFCHMARELGFKVWLDVSIKLKHMGQVPVSVDNMKTVMKAHTEA